MPQYGNINFIYLHTKSHPNIHDFLFNPNFTMNRQTIISKHTQCFNSYFECHWENTHLFMFPLFGTKFSTHNTSFSFVMCNQNEFS